jgi:glycosyltransferase involved in cell wall biosynthesis
MRSGARARQPRLTVCMIVRNEATVLGRCLDSLAGIYDELCIVDTGSSDDTLAIARQYGAQVQSVESCNGRDGKILDFAAARNAALAMAGGDWILQIDADEVLCSGHERILRHVRANKADQVGVLMQSNGARWTSGRLFRRVEGSYYRSRVHEYLVYSGRFVKDNAILIDNRQQKQGKESSAERNIRLLHLATQDEPDEARNYHYLGNEYRDAHHFDEAIACYSTALSKNNYQVARFHTAYYLAVCYLLKSDWPRALGSAFQALQIDPRYAEAHCLIADIYSSMGQNAFARQWYLSALTVKRPPADAVLCTQAWAYGEHPRQRLAALRAAAGQG